VFPGQGAQYVGMGADFLQSSEEVRQLFSEASDILGYDAARLCLDGPQNVLDQTVNTQVTVFLVNCACFEVFRKASSLTPRVMAGHSLGEFSALRAAGSLSFADAVRLVRSRAQYMKDAVPTGSGCMAAIIGISRDAVELLCRRSDPTLGMVATANFNAPGQTVISGERPAVESVMEAARDAGAKAVKLPISVPCHSRLLDGATVKLAFLLEKLSVGETSVPVIPNFDPTTSHSVSKTRRLLASQLNAPVRWQETVERMISMGVTLFVELGPKKTLSNLIKRIRPNIPVVNVEDRASLEGALATIEG